VTSARKLAVIRSSGSCRSASNRSSGDSRRAPYSTASARTRPRDSWRLRDARSKTLKTGALRRRCARGSRGRWSPSLLDPVSGSLEREQPRTGDLPGQRLSVFEREQTRAFSSVPPAHCAGSKYVGTRVGQPLSKLTPTRGHKTDTSDTTRVTSCDIPPLAQVTERSGPSGARDALQMRYERPHWNASETRWANLCGSRTGRGPCQCTRHRVRRGLPERLR
jgi:hypothetical protein